MWYMEGICVVYVWYNRGIWLDICMTLCIFMEMFLHLYFFSLLFFLTRKAHSLIITFFYALSADKLKGYLWRNTEPGFKTKQNHTTRIGVKVH